MTRFEFLKKRSNRIALYLYILIVLLLIILIITLIVPIAEDPTIHHFPFMVYIPYSLTLNVLLFIIAGILLRKSESNFKIKSQNWKLLAKLFDQIQWEDNPANWRKVLRWLAIIAFTASVIGFYFIGIIAPLFLFSPLNMFFLPFALGMLSVWISMGIKNENIRIGLYLFILLVLYLLLEILALIIADDLLAIPLLIILQIGAPILIGIRLISFLINRKKI